MHRQVLRFAQSRRAIVHAMAAKFGLTVPQDVENFFDAAEANDWEKLDPIFQRLSEIRKWGNPSPELQKLWPAIVDMYGAAEQAHLWPAHQLLDYGNAILDSLKPGMIYIGGTDSGRWIPELLNQSATGERHIILTQNAFADATYLGYVRFLYGERLAAPTDQDSQHAFQNYLTDAQKRLLHDQQTPNGPRQVRPGEDINITDNRVRVSGRAAVMAINERILQSLLDQNPDASFALQESFPLQSTYANAAPLGPIMELRAATGGADAFTASQAAQSLDYWRSTTAELLDDPEAAGSPEVRKSYSHDAVSQANLLASQSYSSEAEQAYRLATDIWPQNPEAVGHLADLLAATGRASEASALVQEFTRNNSDLAPALETIRGTLTFPRSGKP